MLGLGILALIFGDFALVWQPVPTWVPGRTALAYTAGLVMVFGGIGLLFRATAAWSARFLILYLIVWLLLTVPALLVTPRVESNWLGFGELAVLLAGGWVLFARLAGLREDSIFTFATGENGIRMARALFAVSLIPIGLSHLVYTEATADLVPEWLPFRIGWAYLTGVGQIACGIGFAVLDLSADSRVGGSRNAELVYAARLDSGDSGRASDTAAMDGVLHFMGDYLGRLAGGWQRRDEEVFPFEGIKSGMLPRSSPPKSTLPVSISVVSMDLHRARYDGTRSAVPKVRPTVSESAKEKSAATH